MACVSRCFLEFLLETLGVVVTAAAPDFGFLLLGRFIAGVGGSIYIGSAIGLTTAWFRDHELVTATGLITGVAFTVGAAIGLFAWGPLVTAIGWREAMYCGAAVSGFTFLAMLKLFPNPTDARAEAVGGHHLDTASFKRIFGNRDLWLLGFSFVGTYGAYFTAAQLLPEYAQKQLGLSASAASGLGVLLLVAGIPGSFIGGWLSDRLFGVLKTFIVACIVTSVGLMLIPVSGGVGLEVLAVIIGGGAILGFVGWVSMPGLYNDRIDIADVPTAAGLMLSIVAVGGVSIPWLFGQIASTYGYTTGWVAIATFGILTSLISLFVRRPALSQFPLVPVTDKAGTP